MKYKKNDLILGALILVVALIIWGIMMMLSSKGSEVVVYEDGKELYRYSLSDNIRQEIISSAGVNVLIIENGECYLEDADCPDKLCVKQGKIDKVGESIVCLPHKVVITIEGEGGSEYDATAQ